MTMNIFHWLKSWSRRARKARAHRRNWGASSC